MYQGGGTEEVNNNISFDFQSTLGPLLQNSKTVAFHFDPKDQESLRALYRVMASNGVKFVSVVCLYKGRARTGVVIQ